ncbi:MAG: hypothetical protein V7668_10535 [Cereibacter changlensis]
MAPPFKTSVQFNTPLTPPGPTFAIAGLTGPQLITLLTCAELGLEAYEPATEADATAAGELTAIIADIREQTK